MCVPRAASILPRVLLCYCLAPYCRLAAPYVWMWVLKISNLLFLSSLCSMRHAPERGDPLGSAPTSVLSTLPTSTSHVRSPRPDRHTCLVRVSSVPVFFHLVEAFEGIIDEETMTMEKLGRLAGRAKERPGAQQRSSRPHSYGCHRGSCHVPAHLCLSSITHTAPLPRGPRGYCVRCLLRQSSRRTWLSPTSSTRVTCSACCGDRL